MLIPFTQLFRNHRIHTSECLHIGANTGQEAAEYDKQGIKKVIWVEGHTPTFVKLVEHVHDYPGHHPLLAVISDKDDEEVDFHVANNGCQSSSILEFGTHSKEHPTVQFVSHQKVKTKRMDTLMKESGLCLSHGAFLNIDLQGAEMLALKGMGELIHKFNHVYIEVNMKELYIGCPLVEEIDAFLGRHGFVGKEEKWTGSGWGDKYYQRILKS